MSENVRPRGRPIKAERIGDPNRPIDIPVSLRERLRTMKEDLSREIGRSLTYGDIIEFLLTGKAGICEK